MRRFLLAVGFLTILPVRTMPADAGDLGRSAFWFPVVGLALGALLCLVHVGSLLLFPPLVAAVLTVALWAVLTGGLHLDGLADCCDGLWVMATPERRLEIMKDPRLGAFGVMGLCLTLIAKVATVMALPNSPASDWMPSEYITTASFALLLAPTLGRWTMLHVARLRPARPEGMGFCFAEGLVPASLLVAGVIPLSLAALCPIRGLASVALAWLIVAAFARFAYVRIGGMTGDVIGCSVELVELSVLLIFSARIPA